jgi:dTDP-4-amino-4,6-dideoxygalactose transaminase
MNMTDSVPFFDLRAQIRALGPELHAAVASVLDSGVYVLGEPVDRFERAFADHCRVPHAVAVNSGTSALQLALAAAGIGPGDEVITVPMTFVATAAAILYVGATPRFVDIDPVRGTMDPGALAGALTPRTRAIIPVHLHGRLADMAPIVEIARPRGITVIEDAAQAHGTFYRGRPVGSLGDMACFSFYPAKNLGACGEGGALTTASDELARRVRILRDWGQEQKYIHALRGFNFRMDAIQGAILDIKLRHLQSWTEARRSIARRYDRALANAGVQVPEAGVDGEHAYHVYAIRAAERDQLRQRLSNAGVATGIHYPVPVHLQPAYADLGYRQGDFPASEAFAAETLSLPIFPELSTAQIDRVCDVVKQATRVAHVGVS